MEKFLLSADYKALLKPLVLGEVWHMDIKPYLEFHYKLHIQANPNFIQNVDKENFYLFEPEFDFLVSEEVDSHKNKWFRKAETLINQWVKEKKAEIKGIGNLEKALEGANKLNDFEILKLELENRKGKIYSEPTKESPKVTETVTTFQAKEQNSRLLLTDLIVKELYEEVKSFPDLAEHLNSYQLSKVLTYALKEKEEDEETAMNLLNSNPNYPYPIEYKNGLEFDYWLEITSKFSGWKNVIDVIVFVLDSSKNGKASETASPAPDHKPKGKPEKEVTKIVTWSELFKDKSSPKKILEILREEEYISAANDWLLKPKALSMVALYLVLSKQGYLKSIYTNPQIATAFKIQFNTSFGVENFQPNIQNNAAPYRELFSIPPYQPKEQGAG